jgi:hypothetical protein
MDREAKLARLAAARARVAGLLTAAVVLVYFGFILLIAYAKPQAAERHRRLARQMHLGHDGGDATVGTSIRSSSRPSSS